jgi:hypothetical protein
LAHFQNPFEAAEQRTAAVERRKIVAHGATVGKMPVNHQPRKGAKELCGRMIFSVAPAGAFRTCAPEPTAERRATIFRHSTAAGSDFGETPEFNS